MKSKSILFALAIGALSLQSCKDDEEPVFGTSTPTLETANYTGTGTLQLLYSTDGGKTFSATPPTNLANGTKVLVKLTNGADDLTSEDFSFDWSASSPAPANATADVAEFTVKGGNLSISVELDELWALITSNRSTGLVYMLNPATGAKTEAFTPKYEGENLIELRGFVYHENQKKFYASVTSQVGGEQAGFLYTINTSTKVATRINENDGANDHQVWDAIVSWVVAPDDSLLAVGDFNSEGNGFVKFGTDGVRGKLTKEADVCCGLGMVWGANSNELITANGNNSGDNEIIIERFTPDGESLGEESITTFEGFPDGTDFTTTWLVMKALAKDKDGTLYGILFDNDLQDSHFVKVDRAADKIVYISTLGDNGATMHNMMTFVPKHTL